MAKSPFSHLPWNLLDQLSFINPPPEARLVQTATKELFAR